MSRNLEKTNYNTVSHAANMASSTLSLKFNILNIFFVFKAILKEGSKK